MSQGAIYGLLAIGIVVVVRTTGVVNFAQGELLTVGAYAYLLSVTTNPAVQLLAVILGGALLGLLFFGMTDVILQKADPLLRLIGTLAISIMVINLLRFRFTDIPVAVPAWVFGPTLVDVMGERLTANSILVLIVGVVATATLFMWFQYTDAGRAVRAVTENREYAALSGIHVRRMLALSWIAACVFSALGGLLLAPIASVYPTMGQDVLFKGFVAAKLGGFPTILGAMVGGIVLGIIEAYSTVVFGGGDLKDVLSFGLLLVVLLLKPSGLLGGTAVMRRA
jgi:branched-chain amino acid transport system permease protein